ncbi:hypothetical protein NliqN6_6137 [Naganishia liquefaciens]|uniref:NAD(P)-binding protein n=1 Tax=Naganishia liquefaciens TaxID=104408 RepID=A0A8H3TYV6_9TREE|nr:hypothetical protein NliqN6_6137 [Naganishia liquefaciens]
MSKPLVVIVSGANRGIGQAICHGILALPHRITLFAASRSGADLAFSPSHGSTVVYPKLDITDEESIRALVERVQREGGVDALVNNAGVNLDNKYTLENAKTTLKTNYEGTLNMNRAFLPLVRASKGRIINLSSVGSQLKPYSPAIQSRFRNVESLDEIQALADEYISNVEARNETDSGWGGPGRSYSVSKALINAFTRVLARQEEAQGSGVLVNCCCPGWVSTDMGALVGKPPKSPAEGAKIPLKLAFGDIQGVSGAYWANDSISSTDDGKVQEW